MTELVEPHAELVNLVEAALGGPELGNPGLLSFNTYEQQSQLDGIEKGRLRGLELILKATIYIYMYMYIYIYIVYICGCFYKPSLFQKMTFPRL